MGEPFSIVKFFGGLFTVTHWAKTVSFGLSGLLLFFVGIGVWRGYFKEAPPTTSQSADAITNHYYEPKVSFGCATTKTYQKYPSNRM